MGVRAPASAARGYEPADQAAAVRRPADRYRIADFPDEAACLQIAERQHDPPPGPVADQPPAVQFRAGQRDGAGWCRTGRARSPRARTRSRPDRSPAVVPRIAGRASTRRPAPDARPPPRPAALPGARNRYPAGSAVAAPASAPDRLTGHTRRRPRWPATPPLDLAVTSMCQPSPPGSGNTHGSRHASSRPEPSSSYQRASHSSTGEAGCRASCTGPPRWPSRCAA